MSLLVVGCWSLMLLLFVAVCWWLMFVVVCCWLVWLFVAVRRYALFVVGRCLCVSSGDVCCYVLLLAIAVGGVC